MSVSISSLMKDEISLKKSIVSIASEHRKICIAGANLLAGYAIEWHTKKSFDLNFCGNYK